MELNKKVKIFGKQIPAVLLALVAIAGLASAGLLTYYGMITGTATVEQSVKLDGNQCGINGGCELTETTGGVAGTQIDGDEHYLANANPNVSAIVSLDSTPTLCPRGDCTGLTVTPKFRLEPMTTEDDEECQATYGSDKKNCDEDDLVLIPKTEITYSSFQKVSFDYLVEEGSTLAKSPHVNVWFRNPDNTIRCLFHKGKEDATKGEWLTYTANKGDLAKLVCLDKAGNDVTETTTVGDDWKLNHVAIEVGNPSADNTADYMQTVWVKNPKINEKEQYLGVPSATNGNIPARTIDFKMGYDFVINAYPGNYTVETKVTPQGTYSYWGVWFPPS
jgi:hypothetical protein